MNALKYVLAITNNEVFSKEVASCLKKGSYQTDIFAKSCLFQDVLKQSNDEHLLLILLDMREAPEILFSVIPKIRAHFQGCRIAGVGQPPDVQTTLQLIRLGIKDFLNTPLNELELRQVLNQVLSSPQDSGIDAKKAKVVTIYSPKGGTGVTFLTANLSVSLSKKNKSRVAVCDLSSPCGDVSTYLNMTPRYSIRDVIDNNQLLDSSFLEGVMLEHSSGVRILAGPLEDQLPPNAENINALKAIFLLLKQSYDFIIIDTGYLEPALLQFVLSESDQILLIGNPDVSSLRGLVSVFKKLKTLHYDTDKIKVIMNRYNSKNAIDSKEFEKITHHPITCYLPSDYMLCIQAVNVGEPIDKINEKSELARKIDQLACNLKESFEMEHTKCS